MRPWKSLTGNGAVVKRKYPVGATVVAEQVVCDDLTGVAGPPASVNDTTEAIGITLEAATYSTVQGAGFASASIAIAPFHVFLGPVSGGATAGTALAFKLDGNLLTNSTASAGGTVISDTNVGTSEYVGGIMVGLTGNNRGQWRRITAHTDNVSETVTEPFNSAVAVGDTYLRTFGIGMIGMEITTNYVEFMGTEAAGEDLPDTGYHRSEGLRVEGQELVDPASSIDILNPTAPTVDVLFLFTDHALNSLA